MSETNLNGSTIGSFCTGFMAGRGKAGADAGAAGACEGGKASMDRGACRGADLGVSLRAGGVMAGSIGAPGTDVGAGGTVTVSRGIARVSGATCDCSRDCACGSGCACDGGSACGLGMVCALGAGGAGTGRSPYVTP